MSVTTWDEVNHSWLGKSVLVRWEDGSPPIADGFPSGIPHEHRGVIEQWGTSYVLVPHDWNAGGLSFPSHAHVQEIMT